LYSSLQVLPSFAPGAAAVRAGHSTEDSRKGRPRVALGRPFLGVAFDLTYG